MTEDTSTSQPMYIRLPDEPGLWYSRFLIYRNLPANKRELLEAARIHQSIAVKSPYKPYKDVPGAWKDNAEKWHWKARAEAYDAQRQKEQEERQRTLDAIEQAEKERILTTGYAIMEERIKGLDRMARLVEASFLEKDKDTREDKINFAWVTPDKIREYRGCLDDIAKELGQRIKKSEITGKDGGPIIYETNWAGGVLDSDDEKEQGG